MPDKKIPADHPPIRKPKIGVLLVNLGTPDGTDYWSVRRYLKEFLSDRRVIDTNPLLWQAILNLVILPRRPFLSGHAYKMVWNKEKDESPLMTITRDQSTRVSKWLAQSYSGIVCEWAMRYGNPSIAKGLQSLQKAGCDKILLFALYPQYCAATSASVYDKCFDYLKTLKWQPAIRTVPTYHDNPVYIDALANSVTAHLKTLDYVPDAIVASFHGLPERYLKEGDPYHCFCAKTSRLLREKLGMAEDRWHFTFQSRFGPAEWLKPYTDKTVEELARNGVRKIAVLAPGFVADCLETYEELAMRLKESFEENGGTEFSYIPCLNDSEDGIAVFRDVITRELQGWI